MRAPNSEQIKKSCKDSLPGLMRSLGLGDVHQIIQDDQGWVNPCFFVNDQYVFRFNARDPHLPKFQREKQVYDLLQKSGFPVPQKVHLDDSKKYSAYDVLISEKVSGQNLEELWKELSLQTQNVLAESAGKLFKQLHTFQFPFFGELASCGPFGQHNTWLACVEERFQYFLSEACDLSVFDENEKELFERAFEQGRSAISEVTTASLIHGDFHFGNILFQDAKITAVLDYEWSFAGDPLYDLCDWYFYQGPFPETKEPVLKAYGLQTLTDSQKQRIQIYRMIKNIELCSVSQKYFPENEARDYRERTLVDVEDS